MSSQRRYCLLTKIQLVLQCSASTLQVLTDLDSRELLAGRSFAIGSCAGRTLAAVCCAELLPHACVHQLHTVQEAGLLAAPKLQLVPGAQPHRPVRREALVVQPGARRGGQVSHKVAAVAVLLDNRVALADLHRLEGLQHVWELDV